MSELLSRRDETSDMKFVTKPPWVNYALFLSGRFFAVSAPLRSVLNVCHWHTSPPSPHLTPSEPGCTSRKKR